MRTITAAEANRQFSKLLRAVKAGETVAITSHGSPVARMEPVNDGDQEIVRRELARDMLLNRLRSQPALGMGKFNREELYDG